MHNDQTMALFEEMMGKAVRQRPDSSAISIPEGALIPVGDGVLQMGGYRLTRVGLVVEEDATVETWQQLGVLLFSLEGSIQWLIGDWIINGETQWGQTYDEMERISGRENATLRDYVYVSRHVQLSVRTDNLSFGHHKLVAAYPEADQRKWLEWAAQARASVADLRKALNGIGDGNDGGSSNGYKPPKQVARAKAPISYTLDLVTRKPTSEFSVQERAAIQERIPYWQDVMDWLNQEFGSKPD